ncbi:hypothetical protein AB0E96_22935 [Kitasatospora sp. NPDC036755]|uniref:hypothetical protein n=1 Tax=Kitasatospora sp. NPDC036755 TaxID=3154600 RepID=UPI0033FCDB9B
MKPAKDPLSVLTSTSNLAVNASAELEGLVDAASADEDAKREKKNMEPLRRKPQLHAVADRGTLPLEASLWEVLHTLGRAIAVSQRGAGRGLAEHWACLKYTQALGGPETGFFGITQEGMRTARYYKALQSQELGVALALTVARRLLQLQHPGYMVSFTPADIALKAGFVLASADAARKRNPFGDAPSSVGYAYRPDFFAEVWKPGEASLAVPIAVKGNHSGPAASHSQLSSAAVHVEAVHIGPWNETPALVFSTELPPEGPLRIHMLQAEGTGGRLRASTRPETHLDHPTKQENIFPGIRVPQDDTDQPKIDTPSGCHIDGEHLEWFQQVLGRTAAAALGAFAGHDATTARYLLPRQGNERFTEAVHAATHSVHDAHYKLAGRQYVGTDHVFRLNHTRIEAFSGIDADLFEDLAKGRLDQYRNTIYRDWQHQQLITWDPDWNGPVSVDSDGTVLAIHSVDIRSAPTRKSHRQ